LVTAVAHSAQSYGLAPVGAPKVDVVLIAANAPALLLEQERPAVLGDVSRERPVQPGEVALRGFARRQAHDLPPPVVVRQQDAAVA
jgi:hypothetical protein